MEVRRIFDLLPYMELTHPPAPDVLAGKDKDGWRRYSLREYRERADNISYGLMKLGIRPGDKVATISYNRPEWNFLDMGILQSGIIHVPIYPTISDSDYEYILNHAEVKVVFVSNEELYKRIERLNPKLCCVGNIFCIRPFAGGRSLDDLMETGKQHPSPGKLEEIKVAIREEDLATLIYTSGTTGNTKGVMLSHRNIISNLMAIKDIPGMGPDERSVSFLPLSHVYERIIVYLYQYLGISIYYIENLATIAETIREVKPDIMCTVPRLLEKSYQKIEEASHKLSGIKKLIYTWAFGLARRYELYGKNGWWYEWQRSLADILVYRKWRAAFGGRLSLIVSGSAALAPHLARTFWAARINIHEGYGLTETSPVISVGTREPYGVKIGTVGPVVKGVTVMIAHDGEILCKGPNVMMGYYKNPELTKEVIDEEGWFHTGDLGKMEEGKLSIVGRKKEIFKTSMGKYISPQLIENVMKESHFIDNIMVVGENQKFAAALIVPDFVYLREWCKTNDLSFESDTEMIRHPVVKKLIHKEVETGNQRLGATEQVKKIALVDKEWTPQSGELTPSLKIKRNVVAERYKELIEGMFG